MFNKDKQKALLKVVDDMDKVKPEYQKMLNNLLGINSRDNATIIKNRSNNIDLFHILDDSDYAKIFTSKSFSVKVKNLTSDGIMDDLTNAKDADQFLGIVEDNGLFLAISDRKLLTKSFKTSKASIIQKLAKQDSQKINRWKHFRNKYLDKQAQINSWPLYVGTMFVKIKTEKNYLYGPLILKKVEVNINNANHVQISTLDESVELNEKLLFLLQNEQNFNLPSLGKEANFSFSEVINLFSQNLKEIIPRNIKFAREFKYLDKKNVRNVTLEYAPGATLSLLSPTGGKLRDKLIELVHENQIEDLLDFDVLKDIKKEVSDDLANGAAVYRITPTDLSQEKAILGSLKDSSIIWGPPGTGKSQTIANILANLLHQDAKVIVTSEKKAALDVIQKRMGSLSKFMFFGLTDKRINKKQFYKPFNELAKVVKEEIFFPEKLSTSLITEEHLTYLRQKKALANENVDAIGYVYNNIKNKYPKALKKIKKYYRATQKLKSIVDNLQTNENIFELLQKLNIKKQFGVYPGSIKHLLKLMKIVQGDVKFIKKLSEINNFKNFLNIDLLCQVEKEYALKRINFTSDQTYLEALLIKRFRDKIVKLRQDERYSKKINAFIKNSASGFRVPYKFVNIYQDIIEQLFTIFVSTPQTLAETIDMDITYDYAIFDEASQLHLEKALPFIALAKKSVIAGDQKQMRPTDWMNTRDRTIIEDDAEENVDSLLDYAYRKGLKDSREYMLTKNYRAAYAQLMSFSSKHFYDSNLDVVDSCTHLNQKMPIEVHHIGGKWEGRTNQKEAIAALDKLLKVKDKYQKIILLTLNSSQKIFIESLIYNKSKYQQIIEMLQNDQVMLRNLENIQGDEADLVIVSVAYDKNAHLAATYVARPEGQNALNVAISRAREKMIVFKSIRPHEVELVPGNESMQIFRLWLAYLELSGDKQRNYTSALTDEFNQESEDFNQEVFEYLKNNLKVRTSLFISAEYQIGSYKIDQALINSDTKKFVCGIEISSYHDENSFTKMSQNLERQMFLETKGYPIYRITELNWRTNKEKIISNIQKMVNQ